ncbi:MAG: hypothetical protein GXO29_07615 [Thermotogae bacterium]|nr:hypothetical protein [Thermotogota bacterium]
MLKFAIAGALGIGYYTGINVPDVREMASVENIRAVSAEYVPVSEGDGRMARMLLMGVVGAVLGGGAGCCFDFLTGCLPVGTCAGACTGGIIGGAAGYLY